MNSKEAFDQDHLGESDEGSGHIIAAFGRIGRICCAIIAVIVVVGSVALFLKFR